MKNRSREVIVIYSNCQGMDLLRLMRSAPSLAARFEVRLIQFHLVDHGWDAIKPEMFDGACFIWEQLGADFPEHRDRMHALRPANAKVVTFPSLNMLSLWPFTGGDPRIVKEPMFLQGRFAWSDVIGAEIGADPQVRVLADSDLLARYYGRAAEKMPDLDRRLAIDVMRWRERDATSDVQVAEFLIQNFQATELFYSFARPSAACSGVMLRQLLNATLTEAALLAQAGDELSQLLRFYVGYDMQQCPINPLVARHFDLAWYGADNPHRHHGHRLSFDEYIVRYMRYDSYVH